MAEPVYALYRCPHCEEEKRAVRDISDKDPEAIQAFRFGPAIKKSLHVPDVACYCGFCMIWITIGEQEVADKWIAMGSKQEHDASSTLIDVMPGDDIKPIPYTFLPPCGINDLIADLIMKNSKSLHGLKDLSKA